MEGVHLAIFVPGWVLHSTVVPDPVACVFISPVLCSQDVFYRPTRVCFVLTTRVLRKDKYSWTCM